MIRVLLVDDEPAFLDMLKFFLEREKDISVVDVPSAKAALERLENEDYDVILSDYSMPGMDGIEFLKVLRVQGVNIPFIMLTGRGREDVAIQAINNGANFYVQKRGDPKAEVVELVSAIRQSSYQRRALASAQSLRQTVEAVVHASPLPIVATDMTGKVTLWSKAAEKLFGWSSEEATGQNGVLACDNLSGELRTLFAEACEGREISGLKVKMSDKAGSSVEVALSLALVRDENGRPTGMVCVMRDIPSIEHVDKEILESEDLYRVLAESLKDPVYIISSQRTVQYVNRQVAESLGTPAEGIIGRPVAEVMGHGVWRLRVESAERVFGTGESVHLHDSAEFHDAPSNFDTWLIPLKDAAGSVVAVLGVSRDMTEHKNLQDARTALKDGETRLGLITKNMKDMITQLDADGVLVYASPSHKTTLGFEPKSLLGMHILDLVHPNDKDMMESYIRKCTETLKPEVVRFRCRKVDGTYLWLESTGSIVLDQEGEVAGAVFGSRDVTERRGVEAALKAANEKLSLLSGLTRHDVDNQMSILMGWLEIARQSVEDDAVLKALDSARAAASAIGRQMEFASDYQDMGMKTPIWLSPKDVCKRALRHSDMAGITINNHVGDLLVFGDPLLEKVCVNLLDNVARHGVKATRVDISCEECDEGLLIVFEDDGVGVPVENKERIFDRGFGKNTGLGLYLARAALDMTGISIRETGTPGQGARFEMVVPRGRYRLESCDNS